MRGTVRILGHQLHPMLIVFPVACLTLAPVFDIVELSTGEVSWSEISFWLLTCGLIGGLLAAVPGLVDFLTIPRRTRAWRVGVTHLSLNLIVVALATLSWGLRLTRDPPVAGAVALALAFSAAVVMLVGGWFGAELVERHGFGVHEDANLDASSSLDSERLVQRQPRRGPREPQPV